MLSDGFYKIQKNFTSDCIRYKKGQTIRLKADKKDETGTKYYVINEDESYNEVYIDKDDTGHQEGYLLQDTFAKTPEIERMEGVLNETDTNIHKAAVNAVTKWIMFTTVMTVISAILPSGTKPLTTNPAAIWLLLLAIGIVWGCNDGLNDLLYLALHKKKYIAYERIKNFYIEKLWTT